MKMAEVPRCRLEVVREKRQEARQVIYKMVVMVTVEEVHMGAMAGRMVEMGKISTLLAEADMALDWTLILWSWSTLNSLQAEAGMGLIMVVAVEASLSTEVDLILVLELVRAMEEVVEVKLLMKQTYEAWMDVSFLN